MTAPDPAVTSEQADPRSARLVRAAIWVAIGALIAAAFVSVVWVLVGPQNGLVGRAFLTILLLAAFAGVAILDAHLASGRPAWFALVSMGSWVAALLIGAFLIWMPERSFFGVGTVRFLSFLLIVLVLQLAVLHVRLFTRAIDRSTLTFTRVVGYVTIALVAILTVLVVMPLMLNEWVRYHDLYWRVVVAVTILAAVGTALVPLVNVLFAPRRPRPQAAAVPAWPTYVDGVTPLPVLPDGSPDWNAYYTGYPSAYAHHHDSPGTSPTAFAAYAQQPEEDGPAITASEPPVTPYPSVPHPHPPQPEEGDTQPATPTETAQTDPTGATAPGNPGWPVAPPPGYEGYPPPPPLPR